MNHHFMPTFSSNWAVLHYKRLYISKKEKYIESLQLLHDNRLNIGHRGQKD
jgi:hypothetical protein